MTLQNLLVHFENYEKLVILEKVSRYSNEPSWISGPIPLREIISHSTYATNTVVDWKDKSTGILQVKIY